MVRILSIWVTTVLSVKNIYREFPYVQHCKTQHSFKNVPNKVNLCLQIDYLAERIFSKNDDIYGNIYT